MTIRAMILARIKLIRIPQLQNLLMDASDEKKLSVILMKVTAMKKNVKI